MSILSRALKPEQQQDSGRSGHADSVTCRAIRHLHLRAAQLEHVEFSAKKQAERLLREQGTAGIEHVSVHRLRAMQSPRSSGVQAALFSGPANMR